MARGQQLGDPAARRRRVHVPDRPPGESHEEQATVSLVAVLVTGALAGTALAFRRRPGASVWLPRAVWGAFALSTIQWTAWSGGQTRHEEVRASAIVRWFAPGEKA
jgi:hypothetical protein